MKSRVTTIVVDILLVSIITLLESSNALICLYGSFCKKDSDCVAGARCFIKSASSSQCVLDETYATNTKCISVYSQCGGQNFNSSKSCCTGYCSIFNQCVPYLPPQCIFPLQAVLTNYPTQSPTTLLPSIRRSVAPSKKNAGPSTSTPTLKSSSTPSRVPSIISSGAPTASPTLLKTISPTKAPIRPTIRPSKFPTAVPTVEPSITPVQNPSETPTISPTTKPTTKPRSKRPSRLPSKPSTLMPTSPTVEPSFRPKLYITIGQLSGDTLDVAEVWFYSKGRRLPSSLFKASATSFYGTVLGPVKDPIGDTYGGAALVNDGNLTTAARTHSTAYNPYVPIYAPEVIPRIILTTDKGTHFDQIVVYNRRLKKVQSRLANAFIHVLLYYPVYNVTLWRSNFVGTKYIYNFTNVYSGNTARPTVSPTTGPSQPSVEPTADPTIYYYLAPPIPEPAPRLFITINQPNGKPLMIADIGFQLGTRSKDPKSSLTLDSTTKKLPSTFNGTYSNGAEFYAIDNDPKTIFWSLDGTADDDANPTLIMYENIASSFFFDTILVYNIPVMPYKSNLAGAKISVFQYSLLTKSRTNIWEATFIGVKNVYQFSNIPVPGAISRFRGNVPIAASTLPPVGLSTAADDDDNIAATTTASISGYY